MFGATGHRPLRAKEQVINSPTTGDDQLSKQMMFYHRSWETHFVHGCVIHCVCFAKAHARLLFSAYRAGGGFVRRPRYTERPKLDRPPFSSRSGPHGVRGSGGSGVGAAALGRGVLGGGGCFCFKCFFSRNSVSFGVFSHSKGFGGDSEQPLPIIPKQGSQVHPGSQGCQKQGSQALARFPGLAFQALLPSSAMGTTTAFCHRE